MLYVALNFKRQWSLTASVHHVLQDSHQLFTCEPGFSGYPVRNVSNTRHNF